MNSKSAYSAASEAKARLDNARAEYRAMAFGVVRDFIRRHSSAREVHLGALFEEGVIDKPLYVALPDDDHDYPAWFGEVLDEISIREVASGDTTEEAIVLNDGFARLDDWCNECIIPDVLGILERVDADVAAGKARFTDEPYPGTLEYVDGDGADAADANVRIVTVEDLCEMVGESLDTQDVAQVKVEAIVGYLCRNGVIREYSEVAIDRLFLRRPQLLKTVHAMASHITIPKLQDLLERFMKEHPYGDSLELAEFMFNAGFEAGEQGGYGEANFADVK